jgi:hypothetical protein
MDFMQELPVWLRTIYGFIFLACAVHITFDTFDRGRKLYSAVRICCVSVALVYSSFSDLPFSAPVCGKSRPGNDHCIRGGLFPHFFLGRPNDFFKLQRVENHSVRRPGRSITFFEQLFIFVKTHILV